MIDTGTYQTATELIYHWGDCRFIAASPLYYLNAKTFIVVLSIKPRFRSLTTYKLIGLYQGRLITIFGSADVIQNGLIKT